MRKLENWWSVTFLAFRKSLHKRQPNNWVFEWKCENVIHCTFRSKYQLFGWRLWRLFRKVSKVTDFQIFKLLFSKFFFFNLVLRFTVLGANRVSFDYVGGKKSKIPLQLFPSHTLVSFYYSDWCFLTFLDISAHLSRKCRSPFVKIIWV